MQRFNVEKMQPVVRILNLFFRKSTHYLIFSRRFLDPVMDVAKIERIEWGEREVQYCQGGSEGGVGSKEDFNGWKRAGNRCERRYFLNSNAGCVSIEIQEIIHVNIT